MNDSVIMCDEVIESYDEETKTIPSNFNEKKAKFLYFTWIFSNYYIIIDICCYLLLSDKISNKTKKIITISRHK